MKEKITEKLIQYKHILLLLYFPFYLAVFRYLESIRPNNLHIIHCPLDQYIPFVEVFVVPYLLWFVYLAATGIYFLFFEKECFCRMMYFGMIGMTLFLLVSWLYPNGLDLRPDTFVRENIFVQLTRYVYSVDTATNVLPSIHVFNSLGVYFAIKDSERLKKYKGMHFLSLIMTVLIVLSTMFIKQHSVVDVSAGLFLSYVSWSLIYKGNAVRIFNGMRAAGDMRKERCKESHDSLL